MGHLCVSFNEVSENAMTLAATLFVMCMLFCGVLATPVVFPRFWIFLYRCSPFTYFVQGTLATGLSNAEMHCSAKEYLVFKPPEGKTCGEYMSNYMKVAGGFLEDETSKKQCKFCQVRTKNDYLNQSNIYWNDRWRDWGIFICYIAINILFALFFYWLAREPKISRRKKNS